MKPAAERDEPLSGFDPGVLRARGRVGSVLRRKSSLDVLLGVGAMAPVYAATDRNDSRVAVKILHPLAADRDVRKRFLSKSHLANLVGHAAVLLFTAPKARTVSVSLSVGARAARLASGATW